MSAWYVRDRGRVIGPLTTDQLIEMRERGQVQGYHEVSRDRTTWQALDLVPQLRPAPPPPPEYTGPRERVRDRAPARPARWANRQYQFVVGGVLLLLVAGTVTAVVLSRKSGGGTGGGSGGGGGAILFASQTTTERGKILADSVGLVVCGAKITWSDGSWLESPEFGTGSGFLVSASGHVITNRHVVEKMQDFRGSANRREIERKAGITIDPKVWVFFGQEKKYEADLSYVSADHDMAILKVDRAADHFFALCHTDDPQIPMLDSVMSLGFPGSDRQTMKVLNPNKKIETPKGSAIQRAFQDADYSLTKENGGIKKSAFRAHPFAEYREAWYLLHTARIAGGNSGGPLIAKDGTVLGINTMGRVIKVSVPGGGTVELEREGQNIALTLTQLRKEIDRNIPGVVWRSHPE